MNILFTRLEKQKSARPINDHCLNSPSAVDDCGSSPSRLMLTGPWTSALFLFLLVFGFFASLPLERLGERYSRPRLMAGWMDGCCIGF